MRNHLLKLRIVWVPVLVGMLSLPCMAQDPDAGLRSNWKPNTERVTVSTDTLAIVTTQAGATPVPCAPFGAYEQIFASTNVFRGNAYRILEDDVVLNRICSELQLDGSTELFFSIHGRLATDLNAPYTRVGMEILAIPVTHAGNLPVLFCTDQLVDEVGQLGVPLLRGYEFIIGVAWSQSDGFNRLLGFGRNSVIHPQPFVHGKVLGLVALPEDTPQQEELASVAIFTDFGVYSQELCFDPTPGACCELNALDPDNCTQKLEVDCTVDGSFFHGERSRCIPELCEFGSCCLRCGDCLDDYTTDACDAEGGAWSGNGITCPAVGSGLDICEPVIGGCCQPNGTCNIVCEEDCDTMGGSYLGNDTGCFPNVCVGACCIPGSGCLDLPVTICGNLGLRTTFKGDGTTCKDLPPDLECGGACCALNGLDDLICFEADIRAECTDGPFFSDTVYLGDAIPCDDEGNDICADPTTTAIILGACCLPTGTCQIGTANFCNDIGGMFASGSDCSQVSCDVPCCIAGKCKMVADGTCLNPVPGDSMTCVPDTCSDVSGACCFSTGEILCIDNTTIASCLESDGRFEAGGTCSAMACPTDLGACCRPNGVCSDRVTDLECDAFGGLAHNPGETCDSLTEMNACEEFGACCVVTGECLERLESDCTGLGQFLGDGTTCLAGSCPTGACCKAGMTGEGCGINDGSVCENLTEDACLQQGKYFGNGTRCDDLDVCCGETPGACCLTDNTGTTRCEFFTPQKCFENTAGGPGIYQGAGVFCDELVCNPGACCTISNSVGTCVDGVFKRDCELQVGRISHPGIACSTRPCLNGACCRQGFCTQELVENCSLDGEDYLGDDTTCNAADCTLGSCCQFNGTCTADVIATECDQLQGVFTPGGSCPDSSCQPLGACCAQGTCSEVTADGCTTLQGILYRPDVPCSQVDCSMGSCCLSDNTCSENALGAFCSLVVGAIFTSDGDCSTCTIPGACCSQGTCTVIRESDCSGTNDVFLGESTDCTNVDCTLGSCCQLDGTCTEVAVADTCSDPLAQFTTGGDCLSCVPTGACCRPGGCSQETPENCTLPDDIYQGNGTSCDTVECPYGACCLDEQCTELIQFDCESAGGQFAGTGSNCSANDACIVGGCCSSDNTCTEVKRAFCEPDGIYSGPGTLCAEVTTCVRGACCRFDGICIDNTIVDLCPIPMAEMFFGLTCDGQGCNPRGACCMGDSCVIQTQEACLGNGGVYQGTETVCSINQCGDIRIVSSLPPEANCSIDARQPSSPDGTNSVSNSTIILQLSGPVLTPIAQDFIVTVDPVGQINPPSIVRASAIGGDIIVVELDKPFPLGAFTCLQLQGKVESICFGVLPGDVNGDLTSNLVDTRAMMDCLTGVALFCPLTSCDVDRSGSCQASDIMRQIDLLNGAGVYEEWLNQNMGPCPSTLAP